MATKQENYVMHCIWTSGVSRDLGALLKNIRDSKEYTRNEKVLRNSVLARIRTSLEGTQAFHRQEDAMPQARILCSQFQTLMPTPESTESRSTTVGTL